LNAGINEQLPSWAPRWDLQTPYHVFGYVDSFFRASRNHSPDLEILNASSLIATGVEIDTIAYCSDVILRLSPFGKYDARERLSILELWHTLSGIRYFDPSVSYINGESAVFAFCQTLSAGCLVYATKFDKDPDRIEKYHTERKNRWFKAGASYLTRLFGSESPAVSGLQDLGRDGDSSAWVDNTNNVTWARRVFCTQKGYYGLGPTFAEAGDIVCVLFGGRTPYCVRQVGDRYILIGECYVHGLMNGEAMDLMGQGELEPKKFFLG
jgi:hypothetical protein